MYVQVMRFYSLHFTLLNITFNCSCKLFLQTSEWSSNTKTYTARQLQTLNQWTSIQHATCWQPCCFVTVVWVTKCAQLKPASVHFLSASLCTSGDCEPQSLWRLGTCTAPYHTLMMENCKSTDTSVQHDNTQVQLLTLFELITKWTVLI